MPYKTLEDITGVGFFLTTVSVGLTNWLTANSDLINIIIVMISFVFTVPYLLLKALNSYEEWKQKRRKNNKN